MARALSVGNIGFLTCAIFGVLALFLCVKVVAPSHNDVASGEGSRRLLPSRRLMTAAQQKKEAAKLSKLALTSADEVFAKVVVPKMNEIIPQQIEKVGDDPMAQVVKSKTITVTDLVGLQYASIQTITASKLEGNTQFENGMAETVTATMELEGTVAQPMTANGVLQIGKDSTEKDERSHEDRKLDEGRLLSPMQQKQDRQLLTPRRLKGMMKDGIDAMQDGAKMSSKSLEGASGSYQMSFTNVKLKMPMTGTIQISTGVNLANPKAIMSNLAHFTIQSITNGNPSVSMDTKLECKSALDMDCHTANAAIAATTPMIDMEIGSHAKTIIQNIIDKVLPMTLGQKTSKPASGTIQGHMKLSRAASSIRRLQQPIGVSPPGTCAEGSVPCGGVCLAGKPTDICCLDPSGVGTVCGQYARCEKGVCLAPNGVNGSCRLNEIACGHDCLVGKPTDKCCLGPSGAGIVCGQYARCDRGICLADDGVGESCPPGLIKCGDNCLVGKSTDHCCVGPSGAGIVCGPYARCDKGICLPSNGIADACPPGQIQCGKACLVGKPSDKCCVGPSGAGILCGQNARCVEGVCSAAGEVNGLCPPGKIKCGDSCRLAEKPTDTCCVGSLGDASVCGAGTHCENGVCLARQGSATSSVQDMSPTPTEGSSTGATSDGTTREAQLSHAISKVLADVAGVPPETVSATVSNFAGSSTANPVSVSYHINVSPDMGKDVYEATYKLLLMNDDEISELIQNHLQALSSDLGNLIVIDTDAKVLNPMLASDTQIGTRGHFPWMRLILAVVLILSPIVLCCMVSNDNKRELPKKKRRSSDEGERKALTSPRLRSPSEGAGAAWKYPRTANPDAAAQLRSLVAAGPQQPMLPPTMQLSQVMNGQSLLQSTRV